MLEKGKDKDFEFNNEVLNSTFEIMKDIIGFLRHEHKHKRVILADKEGLKFTPVGPLGPDYVIGYRVELKLSALSPICYNAENGRIKH